MGMVTSCVPGGPTVMLALPSAIDDEGNPQFFVEYPHVGTWTAIRPDVRIDISAQFHPASSAASLVRREIPALYDPAIPA